jgi:hypothetical protein
MIAPQSQRSRVVRFTTKILFDEYLLVLQDEQAEDLTNCTFFANVKSSLLVNWEAEVVEKSSNFKKNTGS